MQISAKFRRATGACTLQQSSLRAALSNFPGNFPRFSLAARQWRARQRTFPLHICQTSDARLRSADFSIILPRPPGARLRCAGRYARVIFRAELHRWDEEKGEEEVYRKKTVTAAAHDPQGRAENYARAAVIDAAIVKTCHPEVLQCPEEKPDRQV